MKKILLSLIMIFVFACPTLAGINYYDTKDYTLLTLRIIDWGQTRTIATNDNYYEKNPILGKHPSVGKVNNYFLGLIISDYLINKYAPKKISELWKNIEILGEFYCVTNNINTGIKLTF